MEFAAKGRLDIRVTHDDVGKRVSVRRLTESGDPGGRFTDTVGVLTSWDEGVLIVTRRTGDRVRIAESTLVAGKVVPAAPARRRGPRASYRELALAGARAWQPVESAALGEWMLRAAVVEAREAPEARGTPGEPERYGFTRRANSALPLGDPGHPPARALELVEHWYAQRGLPAYVQAATGAEGTQEQLCAQLEEQGWVREVTTEVRVAPLAPLGAPDTGLRAPCVRLTREPGPGWLRRYRRTGTDDRGGVPEAVWAVLTAGPSVWFATVDGRDGVPAAVGRCAVDGRWAGFMAVEVAPEARRRGLATAVMTALARQALAEGASAAWLQVESDNTGALALYGRMGFELHHRYHHYRG